ncbi:MAG: histidinol-phosphatase HisJ family protein [Candidatus Zixiibacteriota bacterium]|nr:MAG: histidinol-phosphatase HisJ family protein [candidate division Zixibacteria bacterium]
MILSDFHVHPDFSVDATGSIKEYCEKALELGLDAICFTTHYDYNPALDNNSGYWRYKGSKVKLTDDVVASYLDEIEFAENSFKKRGLKVFSGIEIDYTPGSEKEAERLRSLFSFDFVLGSIHCVNGFIVSEEDDAERYFGNRTLHQVMDDYLNLLKKASECPYFDALGHLDYIVRYGRKYYGDEIYKIDIERYNPVFEILSKNKIGIELNTSPYRRGETGFHPSRKILEKAIDSGVVISSVGSDCHSPDELGMGIKEGYHFLESRHIIPEYPL